MEIAKNLFCFMPFMVCLCWFIIFTLQIRKNDSAKRWLTLFLGVCSALYLCHALYFTMGQTVLQNAIWVLCSLSVYPLYYIYICRLCSRRITGIMVSFLLLPGLLVSLSNLFFPGEASDTIRKVLFALQIFPICYLGYNHLKKFDRELSEVYADTEGRDTTAVRHLLIAFMLTSLLSIVANIVGKDNVAAHFWSMVIMSILFSMMLFALSHIGFVRKFTSEQFVTDTQESDEVFLPQDTEKNTDNDTSGNAQAERPSEVDTTQEFNALGAKIEQLMTERQYYLTPNLKIGDVVREVGSCRTYVSNYINHTSHCSFSEYINSLRVEHAKLLLLKNKEAKMQQICELSGFASETSFYRNFYKFTGKKPAEWIKEQKEQ